MTDAIGAKNTTQLLAAQWLHDERRALRDFLREYARLYMRTQTDPSPLQEAHLIIDAQRLLEDYGIDVDAEET